MSSGPVYITTVNDGAMDELLLMTKVLGDRLAAIHDARVLANEKQKENARLAGLPVEDMAVTPSLSDVVESHTVLPYKSYKPYVATTFQYLKSRVATGGSTIGGECTFTQQTYGEFICDSFLMFETNALYGSDVSLQTFLAANPSWLPPNTISINGATATASQLASIAEATLTTASVPYVFTTYHIEDALGNILMERNKITSTSALVSGDFSTPYPTAITVRDYVHYAEFPAHALIDKVSFSITNNVFDEYNTERDNFYVIHQLPADRKDAYYKCVCQELPIRGTSSLITNFTADSAVYPTASSQGGIISARQEVSVLAGYQTPKYQQPGLFGLYPNKFDHCRSVSNSLPILAITHADRTFTYKFKTQDKIAFTSDANLRRVKTTTTVLVDAEKNPSNVKSVSEVTPFKVGSTINTMTFAGSSPSLFINNVFLDAALHPIYLERIGFCITRVHRYQSLAFNTPTMNPTLTAFKWPLEYMFLGLRPATNTTTNNPQRNWWKFGYNVEAVGNHMAQSNSLLTSGLYLGTGATTVTAETYINQKSLTSSQRVVYDIESPTITTLSITLQTVVVYDPLESAFYNAYLPFAMGHKNTGGTSERSSLFIPFTFTAGSNDELGGHVNLSRSREFNLNITSGIVGTGQAVEQGTLHALGIVINFWVVSSGNLYLRFT